MLILPTCSRLYYKGIKPKVAAKQLTAGYDIAEASFADRMIVKQGRGPGSGVAKSTNIGLVLPKTPSMEKKIQAVLEKDAATRRKMSNLVVGREDREKEFVLYFKSAQGRKLPVDDELLRYKANIPEGCSGDFRVEKKILDEFRNCKEPLDEYTILHCATHHIMSDTTKEYREHQEFFNKAHGDVLVAGLGLGMIHQQLIENDDITSVTIVEKNQEVIDLVWEHCLKNEKFRLVHADIYEWQPDSTWDVGWFDSS